MDKLKQLTSHTVLTFKDGRKRISREYSGIVDFVAGDIINLKLDPPDSASVRDGDYVVMQGPHIRNQMILRPLGYLHYDHSSKDELVRHYECKRIDG